MRKGTVAVAVFTLALLPLGCGGTDEAEQPSAGTQATADKDFTGQQITFVTYGGSTGEAYGPAFLDPLTEETGLEIVLDAPTDYSKLRVQVESGNVQWDVIAGDPWQTKPQCGVLFERLTNVDVSKLDPAFITDECSVPSYISQHPLVYDAEKFGDDPPTSWADFFDTKKYPGKRGLWTTINCLPYEVALLGDGVPPDDVYPIDYDRAIEKLDSIRDDIIFYDTLPQAQEALLSRQVVMSVIPGGRVVQVVQDGAPFAPVWNQALLAWETVGIAKGSKNVAAAEALLNAIATSAEGQRRFAEATGYLPTIPGVADEIEADPDTDPVVLDWLMTSERRELAFPIDMDFQAEHYDEMNQRYTDWVSSG